MANNKRNGSDIEGASSKKPRHETSLDRRQGVFNEAAHIAWQSATNQGAFTNGITHSASTSMVELISIAQQASRQIDGTVASLTHVNPGPTYAGQGDVDSAIQRVNQEVSLAESRVIRGLHASMQRATQDLVYIYTRGSQAVSDIARSAQAGDYGVDPGAAEVNQAWRRYGMYQNGNSGFVGGKKCETVAASSTPAGATTGIKKRNAAGRTPLPTSPMGRPSALPIRPTPDGRRVYSHCNGRRPISMFTRRRVENDPLRNNWISCNVCSLRFKNKKSREIMTQADFDRKFGA